jgi:hypothetical protein
VRYGDPEQSKSSIPARLVLAGGADQRYVLRADLNQLRSRLRQGRAVFGAIAHGFRAERHMSYLPSDCGVAICSPALGFKPSSEWSATRKVGANPGCSPLSLERNRRVTQ